MMLMHWNVNMFGEDKLTYIEGISVLGPLIGIRLTNLPKHGDDQSWLISVFKRFGGSWGVRLIL